MDNKDLDLLTFQQVEELYGLQFFKLQKQHPKADVHYDVDGRTPRGTTIITVSSVDLIVRQDPPLMIVMIAHPEPGWSYVRCHGLPNLTADELPLFVECLDQVASGRTHDEKDDTIHVQFKLTDEPDCDRARLHGQYLFILKLLMCMEAKGFF